jgi:hypothetical protein
MDNFWITIPGPAWGAIGLLGAGLIAALTSMITAWSKDRNKAKVDAGQLALEYATQLRRDVDDLKASVAELMAERNAYRTHAHVLHEWGGFIQTSENPRPAWPPTLPR